MKIVSFVPSLTETLLECGAQVVGRTRYCIHPANQIADIPVVGGTKQADWSKVYELDVDLVLFDREENTEEMAEECTLPYHATHVTDLASLAKDLKILGQKLSNQKLIELSERAKKLADTKPLATLPASKVPQIKGWSLEGHTPTNILYMIWRNPWMGVGRDTFIGDVLAKLGLILPTFEVKYPVLELNDYKKSKTLILFSSEPYPFLKYEEELKKLGYPSVLVDGENFSWFGIRSIRFLENFIVNSHSL